MMVEQLAWAHGSGELASCSAVAEEAELSSDRLRRKSHRVTGSVVLTDEEGVEPEDGQPWQHQ